MVSSDGLVGKEGVSTMRRISAFLSKKWHKSYAQVCGYVKARISISAIRASNRCIRGSRIPAMLMSHQRPHWVDGSGLGLDWG